MSEYEEITAKWINEPTLYVDCPKCDLESFDAIQAIYKMEDGDAGTKHVWDVWGSHGDESVVVSFVCPDCKHEFKSKTIAG